MINFKSRVLSRSLVGCIVLVASFASLKPVQAFNQKDYESFTGDYGGYGLAGAVRVKGVCKKCDLSGVNLSPNAELTSIEFYSTYIDETNASGANFSSATFGSSIVETSGIFDSNFSGANLSQAAFEGSSRINPSSGNRNLLLIRSNNFSNANLRKAYFIDVRELDSDLTNTDLRDVSIIDSDFNSDFNTALSRRKTTGKEDGGSQSTSFSGANLSGATVINSSFIDVDFSGANFNGAAFTNVDLTGSLITSQQLSSLSFFSGTLPNGTRVGVPEPSNLLGLMVIGSLALGLRVCATRSS